mgnify:CR=1 FL=1
MIWVSSPDADPIGAMVDSITLADATWEVWFGANADFSTVTYRRAENVSEVAMDLRGFVTAALTRAEAAEDWYLLGVQAGFEIWRSSEPLETSSFWVEIQ